MPWKMDRPGLDKGMGPWMGNKKPKGMAGLFLKNAERIIRENDRQDQHPSPYYPPRKDMAENSKAENIGWGIGFLVVGVALLLWAVLGWHQLAVTILLSIVGVFFLLLGFVYLRNP